MTGGVGPAAATLSPPVVVSLISAAVALVSGYLSTKAARRTARLSYELDLAKSKATKEQLVEELMSRYREPLLRAAFDLQSRIYNVIEQGFMVRYGAQGRDHEREYARDNTVFLFAEYFGWVEIMRRDVQFLDLGDVERNRLLVQRLEKIGDMFSSDREIPSPVFRILRGQQRALGELMIPSPSDGGAARSHCIGYAAFRGRLTEDDVFAAWFRPLCEDVAGLVEEDGGGRARLIGLQHALLDLIEFLDDPPRRFVQEHRKRLKPAGPEGPG